MSERLINTEIVDNLLSKEQFTTIDVAKALNIEIKPEFEFFSTLLELDEDSWIAVTKKVPIALGYADNKNTVTAFINQVVKLHCHPDDYIRIDKNDSHFRQYFYSLENSGLNLPGNALKPYIIKVSALIELMMISKNDQGRAVRLYYKQLERVVKKIIPYLKSIMSERQFEQLTNKVKELSIEKQEITNQLEVAKQELTRVSKALVDRETKSTDLTRIYISVQYLPRPEEALPNDSLDDGDEDYLLYIKFIRMRGEAIHTTIATWEDKVEVEYDSVVEYSTILETPNPVTFKKKMLDLLKLNSQYKKDNKYGYSLKSARSLGIDDVDEESIFKYIETKLLKVQSYNHVA